MIRAYSIFFLFISTALVAQAQNILDKKVSLNVPVQSIEAHLNDLQSKGNIILSYSSSQIDIKKSVGISRSRQSIKNHLDDILVDFPSSYKISKIDENRIIIKLLPPPEPDPRIKLIGLVIDKETGDAVVGANISAVNGSLLSISDEDGYFQLSVLQDAILKFDLIGYEEQVFSIAEQEDIDVLHKIYLENDNVIPLVLITDEQTSNYVGPGTKIRGRNIASYSNFLGDNNLVEEVKSLPAVQNGNEGQTGLVVRGGGVDQNLVRLDGVPLYEFSHVAGLSSIFVTDAVSDIVFYADAFPARFGGRLSSIMDITLKSGRSKKRTGNITASLTGGTAYYSGPITDRLSYNVSGRLSWIDLYIDPLLQNAFNYNDADLNYYDLNGKLNYRIGDNTDLSITAYSGRDRVALDRETERNVDTLSSVLNELNQLGWQNELLALNYKTILDDRWILKGHLSGYRYNQSSRGRYSILETGESGAVHQNSTVDILSYSGISDLNGNIDASLHPSDLISIKMGIGYSRHNFTPTVRQSSFAEFDEPTQFIDGDSSIVAADSYAYVDMKLDAFEKLDINIGARRSNYEARGTSYAFTEPRLSLIYRPADNHYVKLSYSTMVQYAHLLINPTSGLPADLWVPSTENIEPEFAQHYALGYRFNTSGIDIGLTGYFKEYENLLEYSNAFDLFFSILNEGEFIPVFNTSNEWERRVSAGTGRAYGLEFSLVKAFENAKINLGYAYSRSFRNFDSIDDGASFPYRYDREHDINISGHYKISDRWDVALKWVYGTGNAFTLALEEFQTVDGINVIKASGRNNFRYNDYHHLDLHFNRVFQYDKFAGRLSLGVYNAYNRLNPFYVYLFAVPESNTPSLRQVSLFPVIPHVSYTLSW